MCPARASRLRFCNIGTPKCECCQVWTKPLHRFRSVKMENKILLNALFLLTSAQITTRIMRIIAQCVVCTVHNFTQKVANDVRKIHLANPIIKMRKKKYIRKILCVSVSLGNIMWPGVWFVFSYFHGILHQLVKEEKRELEHTILCPGV